MAEYIKHRERLDYKSRKRSSQSSVTKESTSSSVVMATVSTSASSAPSSDNDSAIAAMQSNMSSFMNQVMTELANIRERQEITNPNVSSAAPSLVPFGTHTMGAASGERGHSATTQGSSAPVGPVQESTPPPLPAVTCV